MTMPEAQPLIERTNGLSLCAFEAKYLPHSHPSLRCTHPETGTSYTISLFTAKALVSSDLSFCFELIAKTSSQDYASSSMGWHPRSKRKEMLLPDLRYLLLKPTGTAQTEGFLSFMLTYEDGREVIYVYEVHLAATLRGGGIGRHLMGLVEEIGRKVGVDKIMLTVFVVNERARQFYARLGYRKDEYSPQERKLRGGVVKAPDYVILSKNLT